MCSSRKREEKAVAQKVEVLLVDDLDGGKADETVSLGLDGTQYEIDLSKENAAKLRETLAPYIGSARKTGGRRAKSTSRKSNQAAPGQPSTHEVREWAKTNGYEVNERGRIPAAVLVKFQEARAS
jgi:hypothetical protein